MGRSLYLAGSALGLASATYDLSVTSALLGAPRLPDWYLGVQHWADGLGTAYFALLAPAAMGCIAAAILRTRALPSWTGYVFLAAAVLLLGQYAAFRGALPFPQFLAFIAIGIAALVHRAPAALSPGPERPNWPPATDSLVVQHPVDGRDDDPGRPVDGLGDPAGRVAERAGDLGSRQGAASTCGLYWAPARCPGRRARGTGPPRTGRRR